MKDIFKILDHAYTIKMGEGIFDENSLRMLKDEG
jgi:hypothetical protein